MKRVAHSTENSLVGVTNSLVDSSIAGAAYANLSLVDSDGKWCVFDCSISLFELFSTQLYSSVELKFEHHLWSSRNDQVVRDLGLRQCRVLLDRLFFLGEIDH